MRRPRGEDLGAKTSGRCPEPYKGLLVRSPLTARTLMKGIFAPVFLLYGIRCRRLPCCELRLLRAKSRPAGFVRLRSLRYRVEVVGKLHLNRAERHMGRSLRILSFGRANFLKKRVVGNDPRVVPPSHQLISMPFLSGSGEKRQLSKSRSTGFGSEQPEFVERIWLQKKQYHKKKWAKIPLLKVLEGS